MSADAAMEALPHWLVEALQAASAARRYHVEVDGLRLQVRDWGEAGDRRPPLLLIHGYRGHSHWWDPVAPLFTDRWRVMAFDFTGHGDSDRRPAYDSDVFLRDLIGVVERLSPGRPVTAVGHSFGGARLLRAAARRPELFERLVVMDSWVLFEDEALPESPPSVRGAKLYPDLAQGMGRFRLLPSQPTVLPALMDHVARQSLRAIDGGWSWKWDVRLPPFAEDFDGLATLAALPMPVAIVHAADSATVTAAHAQRVVDLLPRGIGPITVPGAHHHLMLDQPGATASVLRALLAPHRGTQHD